MKNKNIENKDIENDNMVDSEWIDIGTLTLSIWTPKEIGEYVMGNIIRKDQVSEFGKRIVVHTEKGHITALGDTDEKPHDIKDISVILPNHTVLKKLEEMEITQRIYIKYEGEATNSEGVGYKNYSIKIPMKEGILV